MRRAAAAVTRDRAALRDFLHSEAVGGAALMLATLAGLVWANSPWSDAYAQLWEHRVGVPALGIDKDLHHWVNDGLMSLFFLVVGLEVKRELTVGELRRPRAAALPAAALGTLLLRRSTSLGSPGDQQRDDERAATGGGREHGAVPGRA